ncbi:SprT family zinc-dependent metalloprotease [Acinetobacter sp. WCHAc010052]|uniref:YgjP family zinc-dependent metalloprotease n=1 Tax=Acinetobacter sp. WCHAc010052 TaxID=2004647 RepID=UPI000B3CEBCD|nr:SprT family zinc-dependent metalloprotease [Acinetobacter sp. WCHAc010052]AXY59975.1 M48 family peptidase [Acinetobacter sp. WCHAc010052]
MTPNLPEIQITHHARATRLRLRVEPTQIKLTVPKFCTKRQIQDFLKQSEQWMIETWQKQQEQAGQLDKELPLALKLFNSAQPLQIVYRTQKNSYVLDEKNHQLFISDREPARYLKAFVIAYAKYHLPVYLQQVSYQTGLRFADCSVRQPKTRWGSCTARHDIMLNSALVLCDQAVARYVCVHELAHTRYFDHSPAFWSEVEKHDSDYKNHRKILKSGVMPWWWH